MLYCNHNDLQLMRTELNELKEFHLNEKFKSESESETQ